VGITRATLQGITATRTVLVDGPLVFNLGKASRGERPFDFHRGAPLRFGVLPRRGSAADVVWVDAECCFAYHGAPLHCYLAPAMTEADAQPSRIKPAQSSTAGTTQSTPTGAYW